MKSSEILKDASLIVHEKSVVGLLGANGAGKTTLMHLMVGLRQPSQGSVRVFGHEAHSIDAKSQVGFLPERPFFYEHLTGESLLRFFGALAGMTSQQMAQRIPWALELVGMQDAKGVGLRRYSKGMLQRIGIAQALIHDPELLVLDEPMSGLDPIGRKQVKDLILRLSTEGRTIIFSSHVIQDVEAICDQVVWMQAGRVLGPAPIGEFLARGPLQTEIGFKLQNDHPYEEFKKWKEFVQIRKIPGGVSGVVEGQEAANQVIAKLVKAKITVLWVSPLRASLEDLLARGAE